MKEPRLSKKPTKDETPFQRFERLARRILSVPKAEIDRREIEWRAQRRKKDTDKKR